MAGLFFILPSSPSYILVPDNQSDGTPRATLLKEALKKTAFS